MIPNNIGGDIESTQLAHRDSESLVTHVKFTLLLDILTSIGGFFSFLSTFTIILITNFIKSSWFDSIKNEISSEIDDPEDGEHLSAKIKDVLSYKGIYKMNSI